MNIGVQFIQVQIIASIIYVFLFCCFLKRVRIKAVKKFRFFLFACVMWVTGSLLMRVQIYPGIRFWHSVSIAGLLLTVGSFMELSMIIVGRYDERKVRLYYTIIAVLFVFNVTTASILIPPTPKQTIDGIVYIYTVKPTVWIGLIPFGMLMISYAVDVFRVWRESPERFKNIRLMLIGLITILCGSLLNLFKELTFPMDISAGIVAAILIIATLYQRKAIIMSSRLMAGTIYIACLMIGFAPLIVFSGVYDYVYHEMGRNSFTTVLNGFVIVFSFWMVLCLVLANHLINQYLNSREREIRARIRSVQNQMNLSLEVENITHEFMDAIMDITKSKGAVMDLYNPKTGRRRSFTMGTLEGVSIARQDTNVFEDYIMNLDECFFSRGSVRLEDFVYNDLLREWMEERHFSAFGCFVSNNELLGYLFLDENGSRVITRDREQELSALCYSTANVLRNCLLYRELYEDSVTDSLTGLHNRKYAFSLIDQFDEEKKPFGLLYLDVDEFKLYNELYGVQEGDKLLIWIGDLLRKYMPEDASICRSAADEFVVFVRDKTADEISECAKNVLKELSDVTKHSEKHVHYVTLSAGISMYPQMAATGRVTWHQAEQAMTQAKQHDKNKVYIYNQNFQEESKGSYEEVASTIYALTAAIDAKDSTTFTHVQNVAEYAQKLARAAGYDDKNVEVIRQAALLHDIGKISIPGDILKKKDRLTDEEYEIMKKHVVNSIDIIKYLPGMDYVIPAVVGHHEWYNGNGYPRGIAGEDIPVSARILSIADSFDAMTSKRSYKDEQPVEYALSELERCRGTQFDPKLTDIFIQLIHDGEIQINKKPTGNQEIFE